MYTNYIYGLKTTLFAELLPISSPITIILFFLLFIIHVACKENVGFQIEPTDVIFIHWRLWVRAARKLPVLTTLFGLITDKVKLAR